MIGLFRQSKRALIVGVLIAGVAACGDDGSGGTDSTAASTAATTSAASAATTTPGSQPAAGGAITLAANPWTGSNVNAQVAKVVLETMGVMVNIVDIDENATWPGLDSGEIDAVLEIWPSGHVDDYKTYITDKKSIVDVGLLGPKAKIGWYVPSFVVDENPSLATWEGFKDPAVAKEFATAESGDLGQFLMGDPSYVSYDEQIIANLKLPLKFVVSGSEAALITAIQQADSEHKPLLLQFWQPHWLHSKVKLTEVKLPDVTDACKTSAANNDGKYACDYPVDELYKAANAGLAAKNPTAFAFIQKFQLTTEQQNEIAALIDGDGMAPDAAAKQWVDGHPDVVATWK
jgi:glycine betaine/proline transport system substrate-binding protein